MMFRISTKKRPTCGSELLIKLNIPAWMYNSILVAELDNDAIVINAYAIQARRNASPA